MLRLDLGLDRRRTLEILCIGAHCDDIEIGCGATLLRLTAERRANVTWFVASSTPAREAEARRSAALFLRRAQARRLETAGFRDGFLPAQWPELKERFEELKRLPRPDLILTHERDDRHQDHRVACELTWNTFRDHLILEYEIPKYDAGLGPTNLYVPIARAAAERKARHLTSVYRSQSGKPWFTAETFRALMRLRGLESNAPEGFAEGFHLRKGTL